MRINASNIKSCKIYMNKYLYTIIDGSMYPLKERSIATGFVVINGVIYEFSNLAEIVEKLNKINPDWRKKSTSLD